MELRKFIATTIREYLNEQHIETNMNDDLLKWFGNSKVVDKNGNPLIVYHGSNVKFDTFRTGENQYAYFTTSLGFY
jgi:hypothetical protein